MLNYTLYFISELLSLDQLSEHEKKAKKYWKLMKHPHEINQKHNIMHECRKERYVSTTLEYVPDRFLRF